MKIVIVDSYYPKFLAAALPPIEGEHYSYRQFLDAILKLRFGTSDFYSRHLKALGEDAEDIIYNCAPLQRSWAAENSFRTSSWSGRVPSRLMQWSGVRRWLARRDELAQIFIAQVRSLRPDVIYMQDLGLVPPEVLRSLRGNASLLVGQIACPTPTDDYLHSYDLILSSFPHYVSRFRAMGIRAEYFRIGFDPIVLTEIGHVARWRSCTFVGGLSPAHKSRIAFLERVAESTDIEFFGYGADLLPSSSPILPKHRGEAWALDMYRILLESRITLNFHIGVAEQSANNMRLYEATGCGALLVTDRKKNLSQLFSVGAEVVDYEDVEDAVEKIRFYAANPEKADEIARAGQQRTLRQHTYRARMEELTEILRRHTTRAARWS